MKRILFGLGILTGAAALAVSVLDGVYPLTPQYTSNAAQHVATGLGIADINNDGWADIVVANGNDIHRQRLVVYYNNKDGTFPLSPSWQSGDIDYHGQLSIGDVNGDELPDVAVSVFLGPGGFDEPGGVKVYLNNGGELEKTPSWRNADSVFTFACALGDADGDGDLDLAVAGGQPYDMGAGPFLTEGRVYYNRNGKLDSLPGWKSSVVMGAMDVAFADMDANGYLDLAFVCHSTPNYVFLADMNGALSSEPSWTSQDQNYFANSVCVADLDGNDFLDLVVSDNNQLGGHGKYKAYTFSAAPAGSSAPSWLSNTGGYGSAVAAEDLDGDGMPELIAGKWWGKVVIFRGRTGGFSGDPDWNSTTSSVIETFALYDLDHKSRHTRFDTIIAKGGHVVTLQGSGLDEIGLVRLNGLPMQIGAEYTTAPGEPWISFKDALDSGDKVIIETLRSRSRDLVVSNWDSEIGNYIFYHVGTTSGTGRLSHPAAPRIDVFPNPTRYGWTFSLGEAVRGEYALLISDAAGRTLHYRSGAGEGFVRTFEWDGRNANGLSLPSGVYYYRLQTGGESSFGTLIKAN